jgi:hypothetical protein
MARRPKGFPVVRTALRLAYLAIVLPALVATLVLAPGASARQATAGRAADGDNPVPALTSLSPSIVAAGSAAFTLTVDGQSFVAASKVRWNGSERATTYVSATRLTASVTATDVAGEGTFDVTVSSPLPGGGVSNVLKVTVSGANPVPVVTGMSPSQTLAGGAAFNLTVIGDGFVQGSTVYWNGQDRTTGYVSPMLLNATVRASDVATAGTAFVSVVNPSPGGGQSATALVFSVLNATPVVASLEPASVWAGGPAFTLTVRGSGFTSQSTVQWAGVDRPTAFVSPERLTAQVGAADVAHGGQQSVRVFTPSPGGGLSGAAFLDVRDDDVPPVTTVTGLASLWNSLPVVLRFTATDVGLGVERTFYRVDGGENHWGSRVTIVAPKNHANDGMHVVEYFSIDKVLNAEEIKQVKVGIDTRPPVTSVNSATVARKGSFAPRYRVTDLSCPKARDALLLVTDRRGKVVLRQSLGQPATNAWRTGPTIVVALPKGSYKLRVLAHDLAGSAQSSTQSGTLTVF